VGGLALATLPSLGGLEKTGLELLEPLVECLGFPRARLEGLLEAVTFIRVFWVAYCW
jgi:hypothetical protein